MTSNFRYTHAVVCRVPQSYAEKSLNRSGTIDLAVARQQHGNYVSTLRKIGLDVIELPSDEINPDCVFVEDTAVVCNGCALICRSGAKSRREESAYMKGILQNELGLPIIEMSNQKATIDGGDVLFTGKEFFVGLSKRTNHAGAAAVASAFPEFPCSPIKVDDALHLKSSITMAYPKVLCVSNESASQHVLKQIEQAASFRYQTLTVPDLKAVNVVYANGTLLYNSLYNNSGDILKNKLQACDSCPIDISEFDKASGSLTCLSILIRKSKVIKSIM